MIVFTAEGAMLGGAGVTKSVHTGVIPGCSVDYFAGDELQIPGGLGSPS
jgi:hypothetical protein